MSAETKGEAATSALIFYDLLIEAQWGYFANDFG
jgi:hypothetical protein